MATAGVWLTNRRLVGVVVDDDGIAQSPHVTAPRTTAGRFDLLRQFQSYHGLDTGLILCRSACNGDELVRIAVTLAIKIRLADDKLVADLTVFLGQRRPSPRAMALLLARMPLAPAFNRMLANVEFQLPLL